MKNNGLDGEITMKENHSNCLLSFLLKCKSQILQTKRKVEVGEIVRGGGIVLSKLSVQPRFPAIFPANGCKCNKPKDNSKYIYQIVVSLAEKYMCHQDATA